MKLYGFSMIEQAVRISKLFLFLSLSIATCTTYAADSVEYSTEELSDSIGTAVEQITIESELLRALSENSGPNTRYLLVSASELLKKSAEILDSTNSLFSEIQGSSVVQLSSSDYLDRILEANTKGQADTIGMLTFILSIIVAVVAVLTLGGWRVFVTLNEKLSNSLSIQISDNIRKGEVINVNNLGYSSYAAVDRSSMEDSVLAASLVAAIAHTRHAYKVAIGLRKSEPARPELISLTSTNLGYYLVEFAETDGGTEESIREAAELINSVDGQISSTIDRKLRLNSGGLSDWFALEDSRAFVRYKHQYSEEGVADEAVLLINNLSVDASIPYDWRSKVKKDWIKKCPELKEKLELTNKELILKGLST